VTRRPKLTLSGSAREARRTPRGFGPTTQTPDPRESATARSRKRTNPENNRGTGDLQRVSPGKGHVMAANIAKALLVVGAAALSIFLLKRRMF
jgi:hypothetical protein